MRIETENLLKKIWMFCFCIGCPLILCGFILLKEIPATYLLAFGTCEIFILLIIGLIWDEEVKK